MTTTGVVHKVTVLPGVGMACAWIGASLEDSELLFVLREESQTAAEGAFENSMVDALTAAAVSQRQVAAIHASGDARITSLRIDPI